LIVDKHFSRNGALGAGGTRSALNCTICVLQPSRDVMNRLPRLSRHSRAIRRAQCSQCQIRFQSILSSQCSYSPQRVTATAPFFGACRTAATKVRKSIEELPQGLQAPLEPFVEVQATKYSPVIDEVLQNQRRFPKCVLLTRVGQFYEVRACTVELTSCSCISPRRRK
jgi:hypothetical protein